MINSFASESNRQRDLKRLKVLFLTSSPTPYKNPLIERLAGHNVLDLFVCFCVWNSSTRPWQLNPLEGVQHEVLRGFHIPIGRGAYFRLSPAIISVFRDRQPDVAVISGYNHPTMLIAILYCILSRTPFLVQAETWKRSQGWLSRLKEVFVHPLLRRASGFLVTGGLSKKYWQSVGIRGDCIQVFANTPDIEYFERARRDVLEADAESLRQSWNPENRRVGIFVGRMIEPKAVDILLDGLRHVPDEQRPLIVLVGDGSRRSDYERRAEGLPVRFIGFLQQEQLPVAYGAADFFVLTSRKEPWGVVVNEAMACGLPVLLSDQVGAHADLLHSKENPNGILAAGPSVESVADGLRRFAAMSDESLEQMGRRSTEIIQSWKYEYSVENFVQLCQTAVECQRPRHNPNSKLDQPGS